MEDIKPLWENAVADCGETGEAMMKIVEEFDFIQRMFSWDRVSEHFYISNKEVMDYNKESIFNLWAYGDFFSSGIYAGKIEKALLDPKAMRDPLALAFYASGWYAIIASDYESLS